MIRGTLVLMLVAVPLAAAAQSGASPAQNWGKIIAINYSNARVCGAPAAELEQYKLRGKKQGEMLYGRAGNYAAGFDAGFKDGKARNERAVAAAGGKASGGVICAEIRQQMRQP